MDTPIPTFDEHMVDPLRAMADHEDAPNLGIRQLSLKDADCFLLAGTNGDIEGFADGFFHDDTRLLSCFVLRIGGRRPVLLGSAVSGDHVYFEVNLTNASVMLDASAPLAQGSIHVNRTRFVRSGRMFERIAITNYGLTPLELPLDFQIAADFRDIFEVRGMNRAARGRMLPIETGPDHVGFAYEGLDRQTRSLHLSVSQPITVAAEGREIRLVVQVPRGARRVLYLEAGADRTEPGRSRHRKNLAAAHRAMKTKRQRGATIQTSGPLFNDWLSRTRADIALLSSELDTGPYPFAGIPWFSTAFGRDGIITALATLWFDPDLARGVLRFLAGTQAHGYDEFSDAAPGKILHEIRGGEMAQLREVPFGRYYGGVDTTPLFVHLAVEYAQRTADDAFIDTLWPALRDAVSWIETTRAQDAHGLVSYARAHNTGLQNQGWKDSADAVFHADGSLAQGPISLVEVQGYAYLALTGMAEMATRRGDEDYSATLRISADRLRQTVEDRFWMPEQDFYAIALDGTSKQCAVRTTNAGHLLYSGLPSAERGQAVAAAFLKPDFLSGWGLRTVAIGEARFNPLSYHNGSVWPHDTAICSAGIDKYAQPEAAARALARLFEASFHFDKSVPELFCGFARVAGEGPVGYPVACMPQAWAAASAFLLLKTTLGLQIDAYAREIRVVAPSLPAGIDHVSVTNLDIGGAKVCIEFHRRDDQVACAINRPGCASIPTLVHHLE
ncbi:glycogen debranching N-terminal domain-containing protein [Roseinatronobacter alkalisoli]|uniref:Glycogen debranching N-terminal domain-containing protein n=1 Tax=Roseinatronobacter alkalisoli TaxID=3028235 RepID=A0ABT5TB46_9RHOB|nr:glycogen debranching N-terminal domain-containing protein [Roseinatronobacter sp. HJB301]MDD7972337.1 glycogen debranching N-terminal domain-containing protein [Roseinatronobacter sp. HJB301]